MKWIEVREHDGHNKDGTVRYSTKYICPKCRHFTWVKEDKCRVCGERMESEGTNANSN